MNHVDIKYLLLLSPRLPLFKQKKPGLYNCRCIICGDSQRSKTKARGFFFEKKGEIVYKCHNCGAGKSLSNFIKEQDPVLWKSYCLERFQQGKKPYTNTQQKKIEKTISAIPHFKKDFTTGLTPLSELNITHPAREYISRRKLPINALYYTEKFKEWTNSVKPDTFPDTNHEEGRIIIPFKDAKGNMFGYQGRSLSNTGLRYITILLEEEQPKIFGLDTLDYEKTIYVTEGPFDSLLVKNAVAMAGADVDSNFFTGKDVVYIFDNEPRNTEITKRMSRHISQGHSLVIWPSDIQQKDINDMFLAGITVPRRDTIEYVFRINSYPKVKRMEEMINVVKRNGRGSEPLDLNKIHVMVEEACKGLANVSASQVEMNAKLSIYDGISTADIQETLIRSASDLISVDNPNYQFVAARLLLFSLRKSLFNGRIWEIRSLEEQIGYGIGRGVYDDSILTQYSSSEIETLNNYIDHDRDMRFTYAGLRQVYDKYLVQDRSSGKIYETPQFMYMLIAMTVFHCYDPIVRLSYVKKYYDALSRHLINIPTPIMAGVRTPLRQYASCVLVESDDSLDSIFASDMAIGYYTSQRAGIGINAGRIRAIGSRIRDGEVKHTGVIPFLKKFEATVRCCTQNGVRGGSATVHFPIWHREIEDILVLKNNKGTEDNRVRKLDYSIQLSKLFYERFLKDEDISLFSPHDVPTLYDAFGSEHFDNLYERYEADATVPRSTIGARDLFLSLVKERAETGRIYVMNIDHCNTHSSFNVPVYMSNLCQEITLPTKPLNHIDDENGEISLCILSAINVGKVKKLTDMEELCNLSVRALDELIDYQGYPVKAAEKATRARRSLGVGMIGLAHYLAKSGEHYDDPGAASLTHSLMEHMQYYLIKASCDLAQEKGKCDLFHETKYADGQLPIDHYKEEVDGIVSPDYQLDWEELREMVKTHGLRNSTLSAQMPSESSSVVCNATNGVEPPRDYLSVKKSKKGTLKQIVPSYTSLKNNYTLLWDMKDMNGYLNIMAVVQKFMDQSISTNTSYNPQHYDDQEVPASVLIGDLLRSYQLGSRRSTIRTPMMERVKRRSLVKISTQKLPNSLL